MKNLTTPIKTNIKQGEEDGLLVILTYNVDYQEHLLASGLDSFSRFYDQPKATVRKQQKDRSVLCFTMNGLRFFLKRHEKEKQQQGKCSCGSPNSWRSEGGKEFAFISAFRNCNLATVAPVAMGEKFYNDGTVQSFLLTEDFSPYVQLEYLLRNQHASLIGPENSKKRKNILLAVADYARNMHQVGFNHQDFNATHVLLSGLDTEQPDLALFDLQRVDQKRMQKFRWPIKALAEFNYSSRENDIFSDQERLFLFQAYKNKLNKSLSLFDSLQWQWIMAKTNRIARHTARRHARKTC